MGKSNRMSNKSVISKDKLCDEDFDKLVIDTSHRVTQRNIIDLKHEHNSNVGRATANQQQSLLDGIGSESNNFISSQPKRPMNAFMVWGQAIRRELHDKFSNVQNALLSKALGRVWRSLSSTDKEPYVTKANQIKANHKRDYPDYRYRPRRIQEKRAKCNMLIGIHLNHPVNQHPKQNNFNFEQTFQSAHYQTTDAQHHLSQQSNCFRQQRLISFKVGKDTMCSNGAEVETKDKRLSYGHEPYQNPIHFETSSNGQRRIQPVIDCRNNFGRQSVECHNECYLEYQHNLSPTTPVTANKQPAEYTYPPYHQLTYNAHQQNYQQQQAQNFHYEAPSQTINYLDAQAASSRVTNTINECNINSYCSSVDQVNQVKMHDNSNFNNYVI